MKKISSRTTKKWASLLFAALAVFFLFSAEALARGGIDTINTALFDAASSDTDQGSAVFDVGRVKDVGIHFTSIENIAGDFAIQVSNQTVESSDITDWIDLPGYKTVDTQGKDFVYTLNDVPFRWLRVYWDSYHYDNTHSILFDGTSAEYAQVSSPTEKLNVSDSRLDEKEYSISMWVYQNVATNAFISKGDDTALEYELYTAGDDTVLFVLQPNNPGSQMYIQSTDTFGTGEFKHIAVTYDGQLSATGLRMYINGVEVEYTNVVTNGTPDYLKRGGALFLGRKNNSGNTDYCNCYFNALAIFRDNLSLAEVKEIYDNGKTYDISQNENFTDTLVGFWKLGPGDTHPTYSDMLGNNDFTAESGVEAGDITTAQKVADATGTFSVWYHSRTGPR